MKNTTGSRNHSADCKNNTNSRRNRKPVIRVRVKSRVRFITFLVLMFGLMVGIFGFVTGINNTTASVTDDYISYTVSAGDTLWDIAERLNSSDTDTRKVIYAICQLNDIQAGDLQPGMVLSVPADL